jgi:TATA-box binding protein (TBP) (component of TFIID and TFIIIB)
MMLCMDYKAKYPDFKPLNLSTMTIIGGINKGNIDIKYFSDNFISPVFPACAIKKTKKHGDYTETKRGKIKKSFYNQVTIQYKDITTKSIKLFSNGKLQITGITSLNEATSVAHLMETILNTTFCVEDYKVTSIEIGMINTNFSFGRKLDIINLRTILSKHPNVKIEYEPDVYPGLKMKYDKTSVFIFTTGNVLITGVKSLEEIQEALKYVVDNTYENWDTMNIGKALPKKEKQKYNYINGYKENEYNCAEPWEFK